MIKYIYGILLGILMIFYGYMRIRRNREKLDELPLEKYEKADFSASLIPWLILLAIFSVFCLYVSLRENNEPLTSVSIAILIDCFVEFFVASEMMVFYHNNERCIIEDKQVQYKNIKVCKRRSKLPLSKGYVVLYSDEVKKIYPQAVPIINGHLNK